jgi:hypothetical protein
MYTVKILLKHPIGTQVGNTPISQRRKSYVAERLILYKRHHERSFLYLAALHLYNCLGGVTYINGSYCSSWNCG